MGNKPTISQNYEWETGNRAGVVRDLLSLCQLYPKRMALACTFAVSAAFVSERVVETVLEPRKPNWFGLVIIGDHIYDDSQKDHTGYSKYLRDYYFRNPEIATADIAKVFGVLHKGDFKQTIANIITPLHERNEGDKIPNWEGDTTDGYPLRSALYMYLTINAYGTEAGDDISFRKAYINHISEEAAKAPPIPSMRW